MEIADKEVRCHFSLMGGIHFRLLKTRPRLWVRVQKGAVSTCFGLKRWKLARHRKTWLAIAFYALIFWLKIGVPKGAAERNRVGRKIGMQVKKISGLVIERLLSPMILKQRSKENRTSCGAVSDQFRIIFGVFVKGYVNIDSGKQILGFQCKLYAFPGIYSSLDQIVYQIKCMQPYLGCSVSFPSCFVLVGDHEIAMQSNDEIYLVFFGLVAINTACLTLGMSKSRRLCSYCEGLLLCLFCFDSWRRLLTHIRFFYGWCGLQIMFVRIYEVVDLL